MTDVLEQAMAADHDEMLLEHALFIIGRLGSSGIWAIPQIEAILADSHKTRAWKAAKEALILLRQDSQPAEQRTKTRLLTDETNPTSSTTGSRR